MTDDRLTHIFDASTEQLREKYRALILDALDSELEAQRRRKDFSDSVNSLVNALSIYGSPQPGKSAFFSPHAKFHNTVRAVLPDAVAVHRIAIAEFSRGRYETAAIAEILSIKMYAAKKLSTGISATLNAGVRATVDWMRGEFVVDNEYYEADFIPNLSHSSEGKLAALIGGVDKIAYLFLGICYYKRNPWQFKTYDTPGSLLENIRQGVGIGSLKVAARHGSSEPETYRILHCVGYVMATINMPNPFPTPWTESVQEAELVRPLNWEVF